MYYSVDWIAASLVRFRLTRCGSNKTRETVFQRDIQTLRRELKIRRSIFVCIFDEIRGVWIVDETLSRVFDISSQSKQKLKSKIVKIYAN